MKLVMEDFKQILTRSHEEIAGSQLIHCDGNFEELFGHLSPYDENIIGLALEADCVNFIYSASDLAKWDLQ